MIIYQNILKYSHINFALGFIENLGPKTNILRDVLLEREQYYLDLLFKNYTSNFILNRAPKAGSTLGFKHSKEFINNRKGKLNPMYNKIKSPEFVLMQKRNKFGMNNPQFGVIKSPETIKKLTKLVYVYKAEDLSLVGEYSTVNCYKHFNMGKDTLTKYIKNGLTFKGLLFSRENLK